MAYTDILKVIPTVQSAALAENAYKLVKKKRKTSKDFVKTGTTNIIGTAMIQEQAKFFGSF